jgi:hypothetical protein
MDDNLQIIYHVEINLIKICRQSSIVHSLLLGLRHWLEHPSLRRMGKIHSGRNFGFLLI